MYARLTAIFALSCALALTVGSQPAAAHTAAVVQAEDQRRLDIAVEAAESGGLTPAAVAPLVEWRSLHRPLPPRPVQAQPAAAAPARVWSGAVEDWRPLVTQHFPADQVDTAMRVMACESRGNPSAKNPTSSAAGLWQFIRSTWDWVASQLRLPSYDQGGPYDPVGSTQAAAWLSATGGWQHWECW